MGKIRSVLFVCTGNSCRSVMAEGLLKKYLKELGKTDIEVSSAGVLSLGGLAPTEETIKVMKEEGVDVSGHRSKNLTPETIRNADLILVMERIHREEVLNRVPGAASKTFLLKEYKNAEKGGRPSIHDPIGKPIEFYAHTLNALKKEIERIARLL